MEKLEITRDEILSIFRKALVEHFALEHEKAIALFDEQLSDGTFRLELSAALKAGRN